MSISNLLHKVLTGKVPLRALGYGVLNKCNYLTKTGNRRFEFERLYLDNQDPWGYNFNTYEVQKYQKTLEASLKWVRERKRALDLGCSIGAFTKMLAQFFGEVTAVDVSKEAIRIASKRTDLPPNIRFLSSDLREIGAVVKYDAIFCAEVLYYIEASDIPSVCAIIDGLLAESGILVVVSGLDESTPNFYYSIGWNEAFMQRFVLLSDLKVEDASRPYRITIFGRSMIHPHMAHTPAQVV